MFQFLACSFILFPLRSLAAPDPNCGISQHPPPSPGHRIVNGTLVKKGELPWLAAIIFKGHPKCTGSVISPNHVLTAAHCYFGVLNYTVMFNTIYNNDTTAVTRNVTKMYPHPEYVPASEYYLNPLVNDIAIIEFDEPLEFDEYIRPICLKKTFDESKSKNPELISGFGAKKFFKCNSTSHKCPPPPPGAQDGKLRRGTSLFVSSEECKREWKQWDEKYKSPYFPNQTVHLCTKGQHQVEIFKGDSGGPLHIQNPARSDGKLQWMQVGICSFSDPYAYQGAPAVFTRLTTYCDWIAKTTKNAAECFD